MAKVEYEKLTKVQKLAALLIVAGEEAAGTVLEHFDPAQVEAIGREMSEMRVVDADLRRRVLEEFHTVVNENAGSAFGGPRFLQAAMGHASPRVAEPGSPLAMLTRMAPVQIATLVKHEQPQTTAFVISLLDSAPAAKVIAELPEARREEVLECLGSMEPTPQSVADKVLTNLLRNAESPAQAESLHKNGGVTPVAGLLNALDRDTRKALLNRLEERNPDLGIAVRKVIFSFEDLVRIERADLQKITRAVDTADLALALKSASPALLQAITGGMSSRAAEGLREEIEMLGSRKPKEVEAAQERVIQAARRLEESGDIALEPAGEANAA